MQSQVQDKLIDIITPLIAGMGYEVVHVEVQTHRQRTLRLFIDFTEKQPDGKGGEKAIGIEDCVKVSRALDEPLDQSSEVEAIFHGAYELEVSSPGVDRPLRQKKDYERFAGRLARLHTFRALSEEEIGNATYFAKNPKQKNFIGVVRGVTGIGPEERVRLAVGDSSNKKGLNSAEEITIPLLLISKANLEPVFEFDR